jgi:hypothetical protein
MNILIATPAYNGMIHIDYLNTVLSIYQEKIQFSVLNIGNESLITRARNYCISFFLANTQFTHLLFYDGDIGIEFGFLTKLLNHKKDVIGIPIALKGFQNNGSTVYNVGEILEKCNDNLYKVNQVGTGVLLLSKKICIDLSKNAKTYKNNKFTRGKTSEFPVYDIFQVGVDENGDYLSEDFYVCKKIRELNYDIYIDDSIQTNHNGIFSFKNF